MTTTIQTDSTVNRSRGTDRTSRLYQYNIEYTLFPQIIPQIISTAAAASSTSKNSASHQRYVHLESIYFEVEGAQRESEGLWKQGQRAFTAKGEAVRDRQVCTEEQRQMSLTSAASAAAVNWQFLGRC